MPSFQQRKAVGDAHEKRVAEELALRGWDVSPWGQGVLTEAVRVALRGTESSLRWTPDLVAAKDRQVFLIDCKSRMTSRITQRHAVERAAVMAHLQLAAWTQLPICYVFDNLDVLTPLDVLILGRTGPQPAAGSGSPYHLVPTRCSLAFDEVFGTTQQLHTPELGAA
ncbi:hypothetical protein ACGFZG_27255 [Streptomyces antibioticus]|uniref:hypothetical protein n=2 Tax=Streptomyces TaxID=1883 RepID=UPI0033EC2325